METSSRKFQRCDVLTVKGRVDGATAPQLLQAMKDLMEDGCYSIVLDLSGLEYLSSAGYRALLECQKICAQVSGGEVVLAAVPEHIREGLELVAFQSLFKIYGDPLEAVGSF